MSSPLSDEQLLVEYLLGNLPEAETERLDERSIADDEFALRLKAAEDDLVDGYVRGELPGKIRERFESYYVTSAKRRERVEFAEALLRSERRAAVREKPSTRWSFPAIPGLSLQWALAGLSFAFLAASVYLFTENARQRDELVRLQAERARMLAQKSPPPGPGPATDPRGRQTGPVHVPSTAAFILMAPTRGVGRMPTIVVPPGVERAVFDLELETSDFPAYTVSLKDPAVNQALWRSGALRARARGDNQAVSIDLPAGLLKEQNYTLELSGIPKGGVAEPVSSYAFTVVVR